MKRNETPRNATPEHLTPAQELAIAALLAGKTVVDAAVDAGVDRATVHRWLKDDFDFQAAMNAGRRELRRVAYDRLERLAEKAVGCLEQAIDQGDVKAALEIVKGMGILAPSLIGSEDAAELAEEADFRAPGGESRRQLKELLAGLP
jgi:hypothetical protein